MNERLDELVARFPLPAQKDGKLAEVDKEATDAALAELLKLGRPAVVGLVDMLRPEGKGGDNQVRHALHALAVHAGGAKDDVRRTVAEDLASTLADNRPAEVKAFVVRQLQVVGGKEVTPALGKLLTDEALAEDAARALVAIRDGAAEQFRATLPKAKGRQAVLISHALGTLRDAASADAFRALLGSGDRDARITAAWALAEIGDGTAAPLLLKAAEKAEGYERTKLTQSCLVLAENLLAAGKKTEAAAIYTHLNDTRKDPSERHVRDAAGRGLAAVK